MMDRDFSKDVEAELTKLRWDYEKLVDAVLRYHAAIMCADGSEDAVTEDKLKEHRDSYRALLERLPKDRQPTKDMYEDNLP